MKIDTDKQIGFEEFIELMRSLTAQDFQLIIDRINYRVTSNLEIVQQTEVTNYDHELSVQDLIDIIDNLEQEYVPTPSL